MFIIPKPRKFKLFKSAPPFIFSKNTKVLGKEVDTITRNFQHFIEKYLSGDVLNEGPENSIFFTLDNSSPSFYKISIKETEISCISNSNEGLFYGSQAILQCLLFSYNQPTKETKIKHGHLSIASFSQDVPMFEHRGILFDCCRHFFPFDFVLKVVDCLALLHMNKLHFHCTEDQAWRIFIEKYPELTKKTTKNGEFYSKEQIKELVSYCEERQITVIPEIEMPGHANAALYAYPELSCKGIKEGEENPIKFDPERFGVYHDVFCVGNEKVFSFLEDVLKEVFELFPSKKIHIGGDECLPYEWKKCKKCEKRVEEEKLKDHKELQSFFMKRMMNFVTSNGKIGVAWDEVLSVDIDDVRENCLIRVWRSHKYVKEAVSRGFQVVYSPTSHCYFDYNPKVTNIKKVYTIDPFDGIEKKYHNKIIGIECNLWSEFIPDPEKWEKMTFPRILAISERGWNFKKADVFDKFFVRCKLNFVLLEKMGVRIGSPGIVFETNKFCSYM